MKYMTILSVVKFVTSLSLQTPFMVPEYKIDNELY